MSRIWLPLFCATAALLLAGCTASPGTGTPGRTGKPPAPTASGPLALPMPSVLEPDAGQIPEGTAGRSASYSSSDLRKSGTYYNELLPSQNASKPAGQDIAQLTPSWFPGEPGFGGLSYAMYDFEVPGYAGTDALLHLSWQGSPPASGHAWVGLANWDTDAWDWYATDGATVELSGFAPYITDFTGRLLVCVLVYGDLVVAFRELRIGSDVPEVDLQADGSYGLAPVDVTFTANASDADGTLVEYRWDTNEVGDFALSTGNDPTLLHTFTEPGEYAMYVRVYDDSGVYGNSSARVYVLEEQSFTFGSAEGAEGINGAVIDDEGEIAYYGYRNVGGSLAAMALDAKPGFGNYSALWDGPGVDQLNGACAGGSFDIAVGLTDSYGAGGTEGLLQEWDSRNFGVQLDTSWAIGSSLDESFKDVSAIGELVFACGEMYDSGLDRTHGLLVAFESTSHSLLWSRTIVSPGNCTLESIAQAGTEIFVCGSYTASAGDTAALVATFDIEGNLVSAYLLNDPATDEGADTIHHDSAHGLFIGGTVDIGGGTRQALLAKFQGEAYNVTLSDTAQVWGVSLLQTATAPLTFVMFRRMTVSESSMVIGEFSYELGIAGDHKEFSSIPMGGDDIPSRALRYGLNGLLVTGFHTGPKFEPVPPPSLGIGSNLMDWQHIVPTIGTPSLTLTATPVATAPINNTVDYDRDAADGDALVHLELHPVDDVT